MRTKGDAQANAEAPDALCDTSVAVPLVVVDHEHHARTIEQVGGREVGLCGHAAFETFSVLTRLPAPLRRPPSVVGAVLQSAFPRSRFLGPAAAMALVVRLADEGVAGDEVYDALVGAAAIEHRRPLLTRDSRASEVYRRLGVAFELLR